MRVRTLSLALLIVAVLVVTVFVPAGARAAPVPASAAPLTGAEPDVTVVNGPPPLSQYTVTLVTGDVLYLTRQDKGPWAVAVKAAPRPYGAVAFQTFVNGERGTYVLPVDVLSLVPKVLDPLFFNIDYLVDNGLTDEKMGTVAAIVDYSTPGAVRAQWSPSLFP